MRKILISFFLILSTFFVYALDGVDLTLETSVKGLFTFIKDSEFNKNNSLGMEKSKMSIKQHFETDVYGVENLDIKFGFDLFYGNVLKSSGIKLNVSEFLLEYYNDDGSFRVGIYTDKLEVSPGKMLKASELYEHLYYSVSEEIKKTSFQFQFLKGDFSFLCLYAPKGNWVPEIDVDSDFKLNNLSSLHYLNAQYAGTKIQTGLFGALETDYDDVLKVYTGLWGEWVISDSFSVYSDFLYSNRSFVGHLNKSLTGVDNAITYSPNGGVMVSIGFAKSFEIIPYTLYFEAFYNSDGYYSDSFSDLGENIDFINRYTGDYANLIKGSLLNSINHNYYNKFTLAAHLRCDSALFDFIEPDLTVFYHFPYCLVLYPKLQFDFDFGLNISTSCVCVIDLNKSALNYSVFYPFSFRPEVCVSYSLYL